MRDRVVPEATIARLPLYLRSLVEMVERGVHTVSSEQLAEAAGVNSAKVRKDLSHLGSYGTRGVGYDVEYLIYQVRRELGLEQAWPVVIAGIGNLGRALASYGGFEDRGFHVAALVDRDPEKVGTTVAGMPVEHVEELDRVVKEHQAVIGVITTPTAVAQEVCDRLVAAGITSVLNFAPALLQVPEAVSLRKVDLSTELQILSYHEQRRAAVDLVRRNRGHGYGYGAEPDPRPDDEASPSAAPAGR